LLYPHHYDLRCPEGITSRHRVNGSDDELSTATIDLSDVRSVAARLHALVKPIVLGGHEIGAGLRLAADYDEHLADTIRCTPQPTPPHHSGAADGYE
jgi:hypothetical protein